MTSIPDSNVARVARLALVAAALDDAGVSNVYSMRYDPDGITVHIADGDDFLTAVALFGLDVSEADSNVNADGTWQGIEVHAFTAARNLARVSA